MLTKKFSHQPHLGNVNVTCVVVVEIEIRLIFYCYEEIMSHTITLMKLIFKDLLYRENNLRKKLFNSCFNSFQKMFNFFDNNSIFHNQLVFLYFTNVMLR